MHTRTRTHTRTHTHTHTHTHTSLSPSCDTQGRYVTVLRHKGELHAIDSICYHAGGPLVRGAATHDTRTHSVSPCLGFGLLPWPALRTRAHSSLSPSGSAKPTRLKGSYKALLILT
jgi:hypothetical protein